MRLQSFAMISVVSVHLLLSAAGSAQAGAALSDAAQAASLVRESGIKGGLVVHVGCGDGRVTAGFRVNDRYVVQGLERDPERVAAACKNLRDLDVLGPVTVIGWTGTRLPYVDNLVNLLVLDRAADMDTAEILRVLAPGGVAFERAGGGWKKTAKPWPPDIDEWTHFLRGADNNAVARDTRVAPPRYMQWVAGPRWGRSHDHLSSMSAAVSAAGRIFSIVDDGSVASVTEPAVWRLVARDAFSGVLLWTRDLGAWEDHLRPFRSGPAELPRRLVAAGERVYITPGYGEPVTALDAATGAVVHTYAQTANTHEIVAYEGMLYLVISAPLEEESPTTGRVLRRFSPWRDAYDEYVIAYMPKHIRVVDAASGELVWRRDGEDVANVLPLTLCVSDGRVFFQNTKQLIACDARTGADLWRADRPGPLQRYAWLTPTVVASGGVVISADRAAQSPVDTGGTDPAKLEWRVSANHILTGGEMIAFEADTGRQLWSAPCHEGFNAPVDVFVINDTVWSGALAWVKQPGITQVYDLHTGEVAAKRRPDQERFTIGFGHARCYRHKATTNYVIHGRAGVEFLDVSADRIIADHWVRGACQYGILPCNGLLYAPPHSCACYITAKLDGYCALSGARTAPPVKEPERLEKGPAHDAAAAAAAEPVEPAAWPTFRGDAARSGSAATDVPAALTHAWTATLAGPLTAPVVAGGRLYVAQRETHTVHALRARDGVPLWAYTAGGRVDSPPKVAGGLVYFGSADGWMYCLRAADGALAWRFRVAPESRQIVAYDQLESVWPVHGNVLVCADPTAGGRAVAYAAAGRSSYVDDGVVLCGVDAITGGRVLRRRISHRDPVTGLEPQDTVRGVNMPGAIPDVLASDGASIFMRHKRFDFAGESLPQNVDHLYSSAGFLDGSWWHRTYLQVGREMKGGYGGWIQAGMAQFSGRALVRKGDRVYGYGRKGYTHTGSHVGLQAEHHLFGAVLEEESAGPARRVARPPKQYTWSRAIPFHARAMVIAGETLFLAGSEAIADFDAVKPSGPVTLLVVSTEDGRTLAQYRLESAPVYDGLAAAGGCLYLTTVDGRVWCWKG